MDITTVVTGGYECARGLRVATFPTSIFSDQYATFLGRDSQSTSGKLCGEFPAIVEICFGTEASCTCLILTSSGNFVLECFADSECI